MSWCDKLASTAGAGFKFNFRFAPGEELLSALSPLLDPLVKKGKEQFTLDDLQGFNLAFTTFEGYKYEASPAKLSVTFNHRVRHKLTSGGPPTMEMLSTPMPFTTLLPVVCKKLIDAALLLPNASSRMIERIGIISTTAVAADELPPGVARFFSYVARPWKAPLEEFTFYLVAPLHSSPSASDRCVHTFQQPEDKSELVRLVLDWQRTLKTPKVVAKDAMEELLNSAQKDAERYFEEVAEGSMFDEELIRIQDR
jgi:hypothetical protein